MVHVCSPSYGKENSFTNHLKPGPNSVTVLLGSHGIFMVQATQQKLPVSLLGKTPSSVAHRPEEKVGGKHSAGKKTRFPHAVAIHPPPAIPTGSPGSSHTHKLT